MTKFEIAVRCFIGGFFVGMAVTMIWFSRWYSDQTEGQQALNGALQKTITHLRIKERERLALVVHYPEK